MTVLIHGKQYVTVAERLAMVHASNKSIEVIDSSPVQVGDRWIWRAIIVIDEKRYVGNAEVKLLARPGSPDATDPWACGETSAIGRALAFAGFGASESIASADEIEQSVPPQASQKGKSNGNAATTHTMQSEQKATSASSVGQGKPRKEVVIAFRTGKECGIWQDESGFYAAASALVGLAVNARNVNEISDAALLELVSGPQEAA